MKNNKRIVLYEGEPLTIRLDIGHWVEHKFTYEQIKGLFISTNNWMSSEELDNAK